MSDVNVISRTQKIIVDPPTSSASVHNLGQTGPAGPTGPPGPPGPGGPGTTPEWARFGAVPGSGSVGPTAGPAYWTKNAGSAGINITSQYKAVVNKAGMYLVISAITIQGLGAGWVIVSTNHRRGAGTLVTNGDVVGQIGANGEFTTITNGLIYNMLAGDYAQVDLASSYSSQNFDARSWLSMTELPSNIGPAIVPPGGITGQVLAKKSTLDYDVEWITLPA